MAACANRRGSWRYGEGVAQLPVKEQARRAANSGMLNRMSALKCAESNREVRKC